MKYVYTLHSTNGGLCQYSIKNTGDPGRKGTIRHFGKNGDPGRKGVTHYTTTRKSVYS